MAASDDDALFDRFCRTGDPLALGELFDAVAPPLHRIARHLTRDAHDAEDLLHGTVLAAIESRERWDRERGFFPWLVGILVHRAKALARRQRRVIDATRLRHEPTGDPARLAEQRELEDALAAALLRLPESFRPVVHLHLTHGLNAQEIAAALDRPAGTVRTQLVRGLRRLRECLPQGIGSAVAFAELGPGSLAALRERLLAALPAPAASVATVAVPFVMMAMQKTWLVVVGLALGVIALFVVPWAWDRFVPQRQFDDGQAAAARVAATPRRDGEPLPARDRVGVASGDAAPDAPGDAPPLATGSLRVRVRFPAAAGGRPSPGILVRVWRGGPWSSPDREAGLRSEATGLAGEARFEGLSPGDLRVMLPSLEPGNFIPETIGVRVEAGVETELDAEFSAARAVEGRVVDARGSPIAGAVILTSSESWNWNASQDHRVVGSSGVDGRFVIDTLGHETLVAALARGFAPSPTLRLPEPGTELRIALTTERGALRTRVSDARGAPLASAAVDVRALDASSWPVAGDGTRPFLLPPGTTGVDGVCEFGDVPVGLQRFRVRCLGFVDAWREVEIPRDGLVELEVVLLAPGTVRGRVVDAAGAAVARARVVIGHRLPLGAFVAADTGPDGSFVLAGVPPGDHEIEATIGTESREARASVTVEAGRELVLDLTLRAAPSIAGVVLDGAATPRAGLVVAAIERGARGRTVQVTSGADGRFVLEGIAAGRHRVVVFPATGDPALPAAAIDDVVPGTQDLVLVASEASARVHGSLIGEDGRPFAGQTIRLRAATEAEGLWRETAADGGFRFESLAPGRYRLEAIHFGLPRDLVEPFELVVGEERTFGQRALRPCGKLIVDCVDERGSPWTGKPPALLLTNAEERSPWRLQLPLDAAGRPWAELGTARVRLRIDNEQTRELASDDCEFALEPG
ncbi:MAG: sigma-70 family RNA polymerase sigma factor, partial [Planctomycetes bacterium]|nr:sigma-70 family RNA polymerase sigma factor [Planctomycetota bacterium]